MKTDENSSLSRRVDGFIVIQNECDEIERGRFINAHLLTVPPRVHRRLGPCRTAARPWRPLPGEGRRSHGCAPESKDGGATTAFRHVQPAGRQVVPRAHARVGICIGSVAEKPLHHTSQTGPNTSRTSCVAPSSCGCVVFTHDGDIYGCRDGWWGKKRTLMCS